MPLWNIHPSTTASTATASEAWTCPSKWLSSSGLNWSESPLLPLRYRHNILFMLNVSLHRLNKFLQYLTEAGFRVSRTHFDPTGVRTDATLEQFKSVLTKYSVPTYSTATQTSVTTEKTVWDKPAGPRSTHTPERKLPTKSVRSQTLASFLIRLYCFCSPKHSSDCTDIQTNPPTSLYLDLLLLEQSRKSLIKPKK